MADQSNSEPAVPVVPAKEDGERQGQPDFAGENILSLLHNAADLAEANSRYAVNIAQRLCEQLCAAEKRTTELEDRIAELEAEVQLYREKSERAELWLSKISNEIQEQVIGGHN
jgi:hypothetical protein